MLLSNAFDPDPRVHREAVALVESGYEVTILCWDRDLHSEPNACVDGIKIERIRVSSTHARGMGQIAFLLIFWIRAFLRAFKGEFDFIHAHDFDTLPLGYLLSRRRPAQLIYDAHESYVDMVSHLPGLLRWLIYQTETWIVRRTGLVITVGELLRDHLVSRGAPNVAVVGNWQDPGQFRIDAAALSRVRAQLGIGDKPAICFIANLGHERQIPQLIEAVRRSPGIHLILGGNGPCREMASKAARENANVTYLGIVDPGLIPLYTAASDAVFYGFDPANPNARYSAPNKLFEALAAGKPVITGNFGEIGRIVSREKCGVVLQDYSVEAIIAALQMLRTPEAIRMSAAARQLAVSKYNWFSARNTLLAGYAKLSQ